MSQAQKWVKNLAFATLAMVGTIILVEITLPHLGSIWHLTHSGTISIGGRAIRVPTQYFVAEQNGQHVTFLRLSPVVPHWQERPPVSGRFAKLNTLSIYVRGGKHFDKQLDYGRLDVWLTQQARLEGLDTGAKRVVNAQTGVAYCFQFGKVDFTEVRCFFDQSTISVIFDGEPRLVEDVYSVITSM